MEGLADLIRRRRYREHVLSYLHDDSVAPMVLRRLAEASGGEVFTPDQMGRLGRRLRADNRRRPRYVEQRLWDSPYLFVLVVGCFGAEWAARLYQLTLIAVYVSLPLLVPAGLPPIVAACALLTSPIATWQVWRMHRGAFRDPARWESIAFWSVALLVVTSALELIGFVLAARAR